jgi:hypothetical protein
MTSRIEAALLAALGAAQGLERARVAEAKIRAGSSTAE